MADIKFSLRRHLIWTQLIAVKAPVSPVELLTRCETKTPICDLSEWSVRWYLNFLHRFGYVEPAVEAGGYKVWEIIPEMAMGPLAPLPDCDGIYDPNQAGAVRLPKQRIWNTLRAEHTLDLHEIARRSACNSETVRKYLRLLELAQVVRGELDGRTKIFGFSGRVGPYHLPQIRARTLFDQIKNTVIEL